MGIRVFPEQAEAVVTLETYEQFFNGLCPYCDATEHRYVNHRTRTVQTLGRWGQPYWLEIECSLLKCGNCGAQFVPEHPCVPRRHRVSWDVIYYVFHLRSKRLSEPMIVEMLNLTGVIVTQKTVNRWLHSHCEAFLIRAQEEKDPLPPPEVISVDGIYVKTRTPNSSWGTKTLLVATDTIADRPIHIELTDGETIAAVVPFLQRLRAKIGQDPKLFVSDMGAAILTGLNRVFPHVPNLVDAYHYYVGLKKQSERYNFEAQYDQLKPYLDELFQKPPQGAIRTFMMLEQIKRRLPNRFQTWFKKQTQLIVPLVTVVPFLPRHEGYAWRTNKETICKRLRKIFEFSGPRSHSQTRLRLCAVGTTLNPSPLAAT